MVTTETVWPAKPNIFTLEVFTGELCRPGLSYQPGGLTVWMHTRPALLDRGLLKLQCKSRVLIPHSPDASSDIGTW